MGKLYFIILFSVVFLFSCKENGDRESPPPSVPVQTALKTPDVEELIRQLSTPLKSIQALEATGTETDTSSLQIFRMNPDSFTPRQKALFTGLLFSDMDYAVTFDQQQGMEMFYLVNRFSAELFTIESKLIDQLKVSFENNLMQQDSLEKLLFKVYSRSFPALRQENPEQAVHFISGGIVENLYLSTQALTSYPVNMLAEDSRMIIVDPLLKCILEQEPDIETAISLLKIYRKGYQDSTLLASLVQIDSTFDMLKIAEKVRNNQTFEVLGDTTLQAIPIFTKKLRTSIVDQINK